jgi:hypothetical protein
LVSLPRLIILMAASEVRIGELAMTVPSQPAQVGSPCAMSSGWAE